jgi:hypothetical protein
VDTGSSSPQLEGLEPVVEGLERTRWGAAIYDPQWRLIWVSKELANLLGAAEGEELGQGEHILAVFEHPRWRRSITRESRLEILAENLPYILHDTPGGKGAMAPYFQGERERALLEEARPRRPPPVWAYGIDYVPADRGHPIHVHAVTFPLRDEEGRRLANVVVYNTGLPATLTAQLVRGDRGMFERMARLAEPGTREVAIMFADLERSGMLSRHTPSALYFSLIRRLTDEMDTASPPSSSPTTSAPPRPRSRRRSRPAARSPVPPGRPGRTCAGRYRRRSRPWSTSASTGALPSSSAKSRPRAGSR